MSSKKVRVAKNSAAYIVVGVLPFITNFFMLPIYTQYLSPADYGVLGLINAFCLFVGTFMSFQLNAALPRYAMDHKGEELKQLFSTIFYSVIVVSLFIFGFLILLGDLIVDIVYPNSAISFIPFILLGLAPIFFGQLSAVVQRLLVIQERANAILGRSIICQIASIGTGVYFVVFLEMGIIGALLATLAGAFFTTVLNCIVVREYFVLYWHKKYFGPVCKYSVPIIFHAMGGYLFTWSDTFIMEKFLPLSAIGLYVIATKFSRILKILVNSLNDALQPNFLKHAITDQKVAVRIFQKIITKWCMLLATLYLALALLSKDVIEIMTPHEYHEAFLIVPILAIGPIYRGLFSFASAPLFFLKKTRSIPVITVTGGIVNVIFDILLIPIFGLYGAAWTSVISNAVVFILAKYFAPSDFSMKFEWPKIMLIFLLAFIVFYGVSAISFHSALMSIISKLLACLGLAFVYWVLNFGNIRDDIKIIATKVIG